MDRKRKMMDRDLLQYGKLTCRERELPHMVYCRVVVDSWSPRGHVDLRLSKVYGPTSLWIRNKHKIKGRPSLRVQFSNFISNSLILLYIILFTLFYIFILIFEATSDQLVCSLSLQWTATFSGVYPKIWQTFIWQLCYIDQCNLCHLHVQNNLCSTIVNTQH